MSKKLKWNRASWERPKRKTIQHGRWCFDLETGGYIVELDEKDPVTGLKRVMRNKTSPDWGKYKCIKPSVIES